MPMAPPWPTGLWAYVGGAAAGHGEGSWGVLRDAVEKPRARRCELELAPGLEMSPKAGVAHELVLGVVRLVSEDLGFPTAESPDRVEQEPSRPTVAKVEEAAKPAQQDAVVAQAKAQAEASIMSNRTRLAAIYNYLAPGENIRCMDQV